MTRCNGWSNAASIDTKDDGVGGHMKISNSVGLVQKTYPAGQSGDVRALFMNEL